jgi:AraC-like DNA-binding protein
LYELADFSGRRVSGSFVAVMDPMTKAGWHPLVYFWDGGWIGVGPSQGVVPPHSHHAVQISLGLSGPLRMREAEGDWLTTDGGVVLPNAPHSFDGAGSVVAMIFVDPECREGRWLRNSFSTPVTAVPAERYAAQRDALLEFRERRPSAADAARLIAAVVHGLCEGPPPPRTMDDRIGRALAFVRNRDARGLSLEQVAREVFLSPSRFAHLFSEEVGLPFAATSSGASSTVR